MEASDAITVARATRRRRSLSVVALIAACGAAVSMSAYAGHPAATGLQVEPHRENSGQPGAPTISTIDSPTPQCYGPMDEVDACYVNWSYLQVSASKSQYIERMTIMIDGRIRAYYGGFFQTSMTVPAGMHAEGFKVACGYRGAGGDPDFGNQYSFVIRARETGGLTSTNSGSVLCPSDFRTDLIFRNGFE